MGDNRVMGDLFICCTGTSSSQQLRVLLYDREFRF